MEQKREVSTEKTATGQRVTERTSSSAGNTGAFQAYHLVYYILGALEILLAFRLVFKLLGANPNSGFVSFIYSLSGAFVAPFAGIFRTATTTGVETTSVLEPATIVAMAVYAIVAWGLAKLIAIMSASKK